jgi:hypothetical protein
MLPTTVKFGRSISEDRARVAMEEAGLTGLPDGSWCFMFGYDDIWKEDTDDDYGWRLRRARVSAKSVDLELKISTEDGDPSVRFPTLSPDFARMYGGGQARWVNVLEFHRYGSYGTPDLSLKSNKKACLKLILLCGISAVSCLITMKSPFSPLGRRKASLSILSRQKISRG